jgi:hypothetical protein
MALAFTNPSRHHDEAMPAIRFWGHDSAIEVSFFLDIHVLTKIQPAHRPTRTACWPPSTRIAS